MLEINNDDEKEIIRLYEQEKYTLRRIAKLFKTNHHRIKRILDKHNIKITGVKGRKRIPCSDDTRKKMSLAKKGKSFGVGRKMPKSSLYKNMKKHLKYDVNLEFLEQFEDIEKLKMLNNVIKNTRVSLYFDNIKYMNYISIFYYDEGFNFTYNNWLQEGKKRFAKPSLDHIKPLSKGGTWDLENLQIIPWCINRAKFNYQEEEWIYILDRYFVKGGDFYRRHNEKYNN